MITEKSLVIYKNRPALTGGMEGDKINISVFGGQAVKVREKDIELLYPGPCSFKDLEEPAPNGCEPQGNVREAWELLLETKNASSLKELAELIYGSYSPGAAWGAYERLREELYFSGDIHFITARPREEVERDGKKREEKLKESGEKAAFLEKLKKLPPFRGTSPNGEAAPAGGLTPVERRFLLDVEALARCRSDKSKTLKELGRSETVEEAHRLLLASGAWTVWENPHPERFGFSRESAKSLSQAPPDEERVDLTHLASYAIDNPWSNDPDDAVSLEYADGCNILWVHVADPAASILPGSPADTEARDRGVTLYLPEGPSRMLNIETQSLFTLGLRDISPALSFRITLTPELCIAGIEVFPSLIKVTRLSYAEADDLINGARRPTGAIGAELPALAALMERNEERRLDSGAVLIELPDVHIHVSLNKNTGAENCVSPDNYVSVEQINSYRSASMVRECMLLAGEGAARWALQRQLPFPYISQEAGELPEKRLTGFAGAWQLRRCMRPRVLSVKPAVHWGLGLDEYTQVTSPLRRYTDLVCHQQIRSFMNSGAYRGLAPLSREELMFRISAAEAAALAANKAERASKAHWLAVYLLDKKGTSWDGVVLDRKGNKGVVIVPALGIETQVSLRGREEPNDSIRLCLSSVKIPEGEASFSVA